jgi:hypothetical protein
MKPITAGVEMRNPLPPSSCVTSSVEPKLVEPNTT